MKQLGPTAQERIAAWPADRRATIVRELGHNADNYDFLVDLAHNEPDDIVRTAAITALLWHFPASEEAVKAWLNAPLSVQSSQDARSQVLAALRQDYLPAEINDRIRHVLRSDLTPEVQVELALALPDKVTPAGLDAILGLLQHNIEYGPRTPEVLQIAQDRAPDRLLQLAVVNAFAGPKAGGWIQEVLNNAPPAIQEEIVDRAWERAQSNEFRTVNGEIVGPLADRSAIARGIDLSLRYELAAAGTLTAADHEHDRAVQEILRHVEPQMLLAEIIVQSTQASYPQSAHLLQLILLRIGRDPGDPRTQNGWLPTPTEVRELIEAFAGKVDPATIPSVTVNVYLASIASHVAPNKFAAFLLQTCREFLDAWALYEDHLERWDPATGTHRPNNPPWLLRLLSVFSRWGPAALPGLLGLMDHRAAEALISEAIGRAAAAPWSAKELEFSRYVSTDIRDGNARREHGRMLQQPDNSFQQQTDSAARVLGQRLLMLLSAFQGPPAPGRHGPHSGDYRIGKLAQVVAHLPSPEILGPTSCAIASGLMNIYAQANCVRGLVRQGVRLENSEAVNQFETSYLIAVAPEWLDQSSHFALGEASQLLLCTIAQERLSRPATYYLTQWRRFSNSREIVRRLGETEDPACWPVLFDAVRATPSDRDGLAENAIAVASLLSPAIFLHFLQLIEDGTFLRWCGDRHNLKRVLPRVIQALGGMKERIDALTTACRTSSEPLAVGLAVGVLRDGHQNDALVQLLLEALDAGKLTYRGSPWRDFLLDPFRAETPIGDYQSSVTMQSCNDLRQALYSRAKAGGPISITCKTLLAELERQRRDIDRPFDEPRHPAIADGIAWTDVLASDTPA
ncbi:MAG TPA: hypothetical protein VNO35_21215 [Steroidobacteraceae bacterium]|nr:hypothetical protein [Steroidobacteraceae bacterium]